MRKDFHKQKFQCFWTIAVLVSTLVSASAVSFRDVDSFIGSTGKGKLVTQSNPVEGVFSIVAPSEGNSVTIRSGYADSGTTYTDVAGFQPLQDVAYNASAFFYFRDDGDRAAEMVNVKLDNIQFLDTDSYMTSAPVTLGGNLWNASAWLLIQLNIDGTLKYSVKAEGTSDFYLEYARLEVDAITLPKPFSVPDGGATVVLLGLGFVAAATARRLAA